MISTITLKPYFGAAALAGTVTALYAAGVPRSRFLYEHFITPGVFEPAVMVFTIFLGLVLIATTPRPTFVRALVERIESRAFTGFSAVAGSIAGWGLAVCALACLCNRKRWNCARCGSWGLHDHFYAQPLIGF